jgi:hypothetical protein
MTIQGIRNTNNAFLYFLERIEINKEVNAKKIEKKTNNRK